MQPLQATTTREIDKATITEAEMVSVNGESIAVADGGMHAGDFYFRPNVVTTAEPSSWFRRVILRRMVKFETTVTYSIVISCPFCGLPIMTGSAHPIVSKAPLTIDKPIACPYAVGDAAHSFTIKAGTIEPA